MHLKGTYPKNSKNGTRGKKQKNIWTNLNKHFGLGFQTVHFFLGGSYQKPTQKTTVFLAEKPQAKAAADAWAAEASEAAKRAKGKVEHGGWEISADDKSGEIFPKILLVDGKGMYKTNCK